MPKAGFLVFFEWTGFSFLTQAAFPYFHSSGRDSLREAGFFGFLANDGFPAVQGGLCQTVVFVVFFEWRGFGLLTQDVFCHN